MSEYQSYAFAIGKRFKIREAKETREYLGAIEKALAVLDEHKVETADGIYWKESPDGANPSADTYNLTGYSGSAGITYLYLELYQATGKQEYRDLVLLSADYLDAHWREQKEIARKKYSLEGIEDSIYMGIASVGMVIAAVYKGLGREKDLVTLREITYEILNDAKQGKQGLYWSFDKTPILGGGTVLFLYKANEILKDEKVAEAADKGADAIAAEAIADERGGYAWTSYVHPGQTRVPNFECGTAGVGYILTVAYEAAGKESYLKAAKEAAKHLRAIAIPQGEGFLVPWHDNPKEEPLFYVSTCHGPAGTSRLFYQLYKLTKDTQYLEDIDKLYQGLKYIGVPQRQSSGYWNTTSLCCGTAGVLQFLINYYLVSKEEEVRKTAIMAGNILLGEQNTKDNFKGVWPAAFERVRPEHITEKISYGAGAAGIAAALLQLYLLLEGNYRWDRLFDDPYPAAEVPAV